MFVDIIIPAYNPGKDLIDAVRSCQNQSYENYIITVIDDNSDFDVKKLLWDFPDVRYIRNEKNLGPGGARNVGIRTSKADVISFLDADDIMHKDKLKSSVNCLIKNPDVGMVCGNYQVMVNRKTLRPPFYRKPIRVDHQKLMKINFVASGSTTVRNSVFDEVGLFDEDLWIAEDYDMWLRISEKYKIKYIHDVLYYYSVVPGGTSLTQRADIQDKHSENIAKIRERSAERLRGKI